MISREEKIKSWYPKTWFPCGRKLLIKFIKKRLRHRCFYVNLMKFLKRPFLWNTSGCGFYFLRTAIFCFDILYFGDFLSQLLSVMNIMSLSDQSIWNRVQGSRNIGQGGKSFISIFCVIFGCCCQGQISWGSTGLCLQPNLRFF